MSSKKYNHTFDLMTCIDSDEEDFYNIPLDELKAAVIERLSKLVDGDEPFGHVETIENEKSKSKKVRSQKMCPVHTFVKKDECDICEKIKFR